MNRRLLLMLAASVLLCVSVRAQHNQEDSTQVVRLLSEGKTDPLWYARQLMGRPYVAHTLEVLDDEQLIVNLRQLDCTTLVENVTALTLCARKGQKTFADYTTMLRQLRYRGGRLDGYPSRLHYFSDWIGDNTSMGFVRERQSTEAPFTAVQTLSVNYMSTHPQAYKALRQHPEYVEPIARQERTLSGQRFRYIPKSQVKNTEALRRMVHDGDIIAITTSKAGLDIAHLGFAVWRKDGLHLLNASQIHKRVVEEPMTLGQYLSKHPSHTGIRVITIL